MQIQFVYINLSFIVSYRGNNILFITLNTSHWNMLIEMRWRIKVKTIIQCRQIIYILPLSKIVQLFLRHYCQFCMKLPKKRNKIKERTITCSYIWYIYISNCVYWLDTHSEKVWWRDVLPNTNAVYLCDIFFRT